MPHDKSPETEISTKEYFSVIDRFLRHVHSSLFIRLRFFSLFVSVLIYAAIVILFGHKLKISSNYFVILPVLTAALTFGLPGGITAGALALPANLLLFMILKSPEYSPASKIIAELSGIVVGTSFGYLSDYFTKLEREIERRKEIEINLKHLIEDKDMLVHEIHHRVKNNLNIIKSLIRLQTNRIDDPVFINQSNKLIQRIYTIALIHEQLFSGQYASAIDMKDYMTTLADNIVKYRGEGLMKIRTEVHSEIVFMPIDLATPLGLIINEVLTNIMKHAFNGISGPVIEISFLKTDDQYQLCIHDNGSGFNPEELKNDGLGLKLIKSLSAQLKGTYNFRKKDGTCFTLSFPAYFPNPGF